MAFLTTKDDVKLQSYRLKDLKTKDKSKHAVIISVPINRNSPSLQIWKYCP